MTPERRLAGALIFMAAGLCFVGMDTLAKLLSTRVHPIQTLWARYLAQTILVVLICLRTLPALLRTRHPVAQSFRSIFLFGATACFFIGYEVNSLTLTVAIANTAPFLVGIGAALFLGERFGPARIGATIIGLFGALIIIRPFGEAFTPWAILPFLGALFYSSYALTTRAIGSDDSLMTSAFYSALLASVLLTLAVPFFWEPLEASDLPYLLGIGLVGTLGQLLLIQALSLAQAGFLAPFMYIQVVGAVIAQFIVFEMLPDRWTLLGAALIIAAGLVVWWRSQREQI